jgi:hypothetical protein
LYIPLTYPWHTPWPLARVRVSWGYRIPTPTLPSCTLTPDPWGFWYPWQSLPRAQSDSAPDFYDIWHTHTHSAPLFVGSMNDKINDMPASRVIQRMLKHRRSRSASGWAYPDRLLSNAQRINSFFNWPIVILFYSHRVRLHDAYNQILLPPSLLVFQLAHGFFQSQIRSSGAPIFAFVFTTLYVFALVFMMLFLRSFLRRYMFLRSFLRCCFCVRFYYNTIFAFVFTTPYIFRQHA